MSLKKIVMPLILLNIKMQFEHDTNSLVRRSLPAPKNGVENGEP